ncbi:MAG: hypothetical protein PHW60_00980 [Kiritimatiellae bacterium]|nr:hypothetical protein [Kiritimatiellia bacterium]
MKRQTHNEPDFKTACGWWSDLPNIWTPVGWKDHLFHFNVFWNGMIMAEPNLNRRSENWKGKGAQVSILPISQRPDDGLATQGWTSSPAPVLWTDCPHEGILFRHEVFAHLPGGCDTRTGDEPLFAWIRLSLADTVPALPLEESAAFIVAIQGPHLTYSMNLRDNVRYKPELSMYPRSLVAESMAYNIKKGLRILEPDGKVRLAMAPGAGCHTKFTGPNLTNSAYGLSIELRTRKGAFADLLLPMIPTERKIVDRELALGYAGALREAERYWSARSRNAASVSVPEAPVTGAIRHSVRLSHLITERNPATGNVCKLSGSLAYANLWSTPLAMDLIMMMDTLGYHEFTARYLEIFREEQGTVVPPGDAYKPHPGYLSTPAAYKSIDWLADNGAILYTLSMHGLLSGDNDYIGRFTETIVKSCEWLKIHRAMKNHGGYEGILPAAVATDARTKIQAVWSDGWNYKGLCAATRLLKKIGHPRAGEFEQEARDYKAAYLKALRHKCRTMPTWKDAHGLRHTLVPTALFGDKRAETRHAFYLDTGPLFLVFAGLVNADDPLMRDTMAWFREGPPTALHRRDANCWQVPVLDHEMSSCEPPYSWNVFHPWQLGDRKKFLEGMYSLFAGAISRKTFVSCETRGGITGNVFSAPLAIYMARLAVLDDQLQEGELHLLRLMPLAWLKPGATAEFARMSTEFGPVTLITKVSREGRILDVTFKPEFRPGEAPAKIVFHVPPAPGLKTLKLNGRAVDVRKKRITL